MDRIVAVARGMLACATLLTIAAVVGSFAGVWATGGASKGHVPVGAVWLAIAAAALWCLLLIGVALYVAWRILVALAEAVVWLEHRHERRQP